MAEEEEREDMVKGVPDKLADKLIGEFLDGRGYAEQMVRAIEALPDALRFDALRSLCMEVGWTRAQLGRLDDIKKELGDQHCGVFAQMVAVVLKTIKDTGIRMKPADILAREGGAEEDGEEVSADD